MLFLFFFCVLNFSRNIKTGNFVRTVEDFRDWTDWLLYRGGIGVKGEESWEAWWDEEMVCFC